MSRTQRSNLASDLALIGVFAALITVCSLLPGIPLAAGVPITLQTFAVMVTGLILGPWRALAATGLYLLLGLAGLPVFAGGAGSLAVLVSPTAGFLLSFPVSALIVGAVAYRIARQNPRLLFLFFALAAFGVIIVITFSAGVLGLMINAHLEFAPAVLSAAAFVPGELIKAVLAGVIAAAVHRGFKNFLVEQQ